ncbi:hypothetical protein BU24DRAFT_421311 [Aaosphaeria arxii CBS 175.79]|uniref:tRNA (guanine(9)-N1)-methyltransferase n=1 Tax=Aaosphaeria arxii CBS 175.79 TaxID=1450172 RepID=A0A6A5XZC6_9PLEO|nr:uncharacterized protein BU24DRAFT_421311 [Aaosphaeria arxii CBS 175.79]KAF2018326.1 hypothetical protein BU24DRAFT_421311 [Aaosphaeria arxii CBS 175.79]
MESEERPSKLRKLEHGAEPEVVHVLDTPTDIDGTGPTPVQHVTSATNNDGDATEYNLPANEGEEAAPKLSKNQLKKQRRFERWEAGREDRKQKRREKIKEKKERRREVFREAERTGDTANLPPPRRDMRHRGPDGAQMPITVIFDCDFEDLMFDNELKSLGLQITRCYSDNRKAPYRAHLALSSFGGKMKERFDGILAKQYTSWKGFRFFSEDFVEVAQKSKEWMSGERGGIVGGALVQDDKTTENDNDEGEIVYLSSESDVTLERLKPNSTYIIGGLVDKNRHKGICHRRAVERGIKTAKLPIGQFLEMKSRQVLVTNHVLEIMLKWMEFGDWGKAFMEVIPKRKGGVLKGEAEGGEEDDEDDKDDADEEQGTSEANVDTDIQISEETNNRELGGTSAEEASGEVQSVVPTSTSG